MVKLLLIWAAYVLVGHALGRFGRSWAVLGSAGVGAQLGFTAILFYIRGESLWREGFGPLIFATFAATVGMFVVGALGAWASSPGVSSRRLIWVNAVVGIGSAVLVVVCEAWPF
jgi:hypothetical protein